MRDEPWKRHAPVRFRTCPPFVSYQSDYLTHTTPTQRDVLIEYVDAGESLWFNNYLRGIHMEELSESAKSELRRKTSALNVLIRNAPLSRSRTLLFRAIAQDAPRKSFYERGDDAEFVNRGIVSTSISYRAAREFLEEDETCCMLVLLLPANTPMLEVLDVSAWSEEAEVLLPHGCVFKVHATAVVEGTTTYFCVLTRVLNAR